MLGSIYVCTNTASMSTTILFQTNTFGYSSTIDYVYNSLSGSDNCQENCFYEYKHWIRSSLFNLKSNYVHINLFHSKEAGHENEDDSKNTRMNGKRLETTITSFFQFPVPQCSSDASNIGYFKKMITNYTNIYLGFYILIVWNDRKNLYDV